MAVDISKLHDTTDAQVWAQEFMANFGHRLNEIDEGLMIGWFANAIQTAVALVRTLPVHERMEAMGMESAAGGTLGGRPMFVEHVDV